MRNSAQWKNACYWCMGSNPGDAEVKPPWMLFRNTLQWRLAPPFLKPFPPFTASLHAGSALVLGLKQLIRRPTERILIYSMRADLREDPRKFSPRINRTSIEMVYIFV